MDISSSKKQIFREGRTVIHAGLYSGWILECLSWFEGLVTSRWRYREVVEMSGSKTLWENLGPWERALEGCIILVFLDPSSVCIPSLMK